jgi:uncharacterized protein
MLEVANGLIDNNEVRTFNLRITGGEPLLAFDNFKDILNNLDKSRFTLELNTNATILNDEIIAWIKNNDISPGISLDNIGFQKPFINGKSSHEVVIKNIETLAKNNVSMGICTVFDYRNFDSFVDLANFVCDHKQHVGEFSCSTDFIEDYFDENDVNKMEKIYKEIIDVLYKRNFDIFNILKFENVKLGQISYCPAGRDLISVDADLNVSPCQSLINEIDLGKFDKNVIERMSIQDNNRYYWERGLPELCDNCKIFDFCFGGCRLQHKHLNVLKNRCELRKRVFKYVQRYI